MPEPDPDPRYFTAPYLQDLRERLTRRYGHALPASLVDTIITTSIDHYHDARVRTFIPILVERHAEARLHQITRLLDHDQSTTTTRAVND